MSQMPVGIDRVEGLLGWIHERPDMYCCLAGELDSVLHFLHLAWAVVKDREDDLFAARITIDSSAAGLLSDAERVRPVRRGDEATDRVLDYWARVDSSLGVKRFKVEPAAGE